MKKTKIYVGIIFYNDDLFLFENCLKSIKKFNLPIVAVDGRYHEFLPGPSEEPYSNLECINLARKYCDVLITNEEPWKDQVAKRNSLLQSFYGDYCLFIDADEELVKYEIGNLEEDLYMVDIVDMKYRFREPHYRFCRSTMQLKDKHYFKKPEIKDGKIVGPRQNIVLNHFKHCRNEDRIKQKQYYYQNRLENLVRS